MAQIQLPTKAKTPYWGLVPIKPYYLVSFQLDHFVYGVTFTIPSLYLIMIANQPKKQFVMYRLYCHSRFW